ncbi:hypothetical protein Ct61P_10306 [Colletotrichum tofieldiae]|nr:hypothetical protein Ct61P_10306 [Colletotrichum tofieldiae]
MYCVVRSLSLPYISVVDGNFVPDEKTLRAIFAGVDVKRNDLKIICNTDVLRGWVLKAGAKAPGNFTEEGKDNLEQEVLRELGSR